MYAHINENKISENCFVTDKSYPNRDKEIKLPQTPISETHLKRY